ncbi:MAG: transporter protein [Acidimicrobiales bacterium]|jgi:peptide/nickel transport system ATP-binding protein|nr:transporter protein [Acidimicrobiales bacterium]
MAGSGTAPLRDGREDIVLRVEHLVVEFPTKGGRVQAVSDVSFDVAKGETLGLVGESGCGKSTTGRAVMQLPRPRSGRVALEGTELTSLSPEELREMRPKMQLIFQDPISSLNPRRVVVDIVAEPLAIWGIEENRRFRVNHLLETVGLDTDTAARRPHQLSGGQCQRVSIARALVMDPQVLICDEPVSALDVSVQAQILNLLEDMKARYGLTMVFISHDLSVVKNISDRVAVMYLGKLCEIAPSEALYRRPAHPYTNALLASVPHPDASRVRGKSVPLTGELPSALDPPSGCRFRTRCPRAEARCADEEPTMRELQPGQFVACHFPVTPGRPLVTTPTGALGAPA